MPVRFPLHLSSRQLDIWFQSWEEISRNHLLTQTLLRIKFPVSFILWWVPVISISTHLPIPYFLIFWSGQLLQSIKCYSNFLIQLVKYLLDYIWFLSLMRNLTYSQIIFLPQLGVDFVLSILLSISSVSCHLILQNLYEIGITTVYVLLMNKLKSRDI